jgi:hypothetical protein
VEPVADVIGRDLGRTFPEHPLFTDGDGQARLGRLLRAYALRDEEIGYCQGQGGRGRAGGRAREGGLAGRTWQSSSQAGGSGVARLFPARRQPSSLHPITNYPKPALQPLPLACC